MRITCCSRSSIGAHRKSVGFSNRVQCCKSTSGCISPRPCHTRFDSRYLAGSTYLCPSTALVTSRHTRHQVQVQRGVYRRLRGQGVQTLGCLAWEPLSEQRRAAAPAAAALRHQRTPTSNPSTTQALEQRDLRLPALLKQGAPELSARHDTLDAPCWDAGAAVDCGHVPGDRRCAQLGMGRARWTAVGAGELKVKGPRSQLGIRPGQEGISVGSDIRPGDSAPAGAIGSRDWQGKLSPDCQTRGVTAGGPTLLSVRGTGHIHLPCALHLRRQSFGTGFGGVCGQDRLAERGLG